MTDVLLIGATGWHGAKLAESFRMLGIPVRRRGFGQLAFATGRLGLRCGGPLPGAVLVRSIPDGSFEQITLRLGLLHALADREVPVVNEAKAIERCVDKSMTVFRLERAGLPVPPSWTTELPRKAAAIVAREAAAGHATVLKPLFGSQGRGLRLLRGPDDLPPPDEVAGVYHLQRFVGATADWHDFRVLVIDGAATAAMVRRGISWITNVRQGARPEPLAVDGQIGELAVAAARAVGCVYAGVDLIRDPSGRLLLLEVNSMPAWRGLQAVTRIDLAARLAGAVAARARPLARAA
jgi:RimK family alpha-L-glutamate ligase